MNILDVTLRESVYYGKGLSNDDALEYLQMLKQNVSNRFIQFVEIGYLNNNTATPLNYDADYFTRAIDLCEGTFKATAMMHIPKSHMDGWDPEIVRRLALVRVVIGHHVPDELKPFVDYFHNLGVKVSANITYSVDLSDEKIISEINRAADMGVDYIFCADSSGSYTASSTARISKLLVENCRHMIPGVHLHDHMQMSLANALTAQENGIHVTDVSVTGAGKGGGNLKMELGLLVLYGTDVVTLEMLQGLKNMVVYFSNLIGRDANFYTQALMDFLTGIYHLRLGDTDRLEAESQMDPDTYFRLVTEGYQVHPLNENA